MSDTPNPDIRMLEELQLHLKVRSGEYCAARIGTTLVLYFGKSMRDLSGTVAKLLERYLSFIPEGSIQSLLSATGVWREFSRQGLSSAVRKLSADGAEYSSVNLSSGAPAHVGEYGFHFFGTDMSHADLWPRETCACIMEFPLGALAPDRRQGFEDFAAAVADMEAFEAGHAGYAFKHLARTWRDQALPWISQRAPRFLGLDISYDTFKVAARRRVVNVSWLTLLGHGVTEDLGGEARIREQLSPEVRIRPLKTGLLLVAGETPPIGDVNRGLQDVRWLKEVAALTKPVRARMQIGFGSDTFRSTWLDRLD